MNWSKNCQKAEPLLSSGDNCFAQAPPSEPITERHVEGKSTADLLAKLAIVEEEADETAYWLELLVESRTIDENRVAELLKETNEITAMVVASIKTLRGRL